MADLPELLKRSWTWLLGLGIVFIILGMIGLNMAVQVTLASIFILGILLFVASFAQWLDVFQSRQWKGALWHALIALLYLLAGGIVIYDPILTSAVLTGLLAWILIAIGLTRLLLLYILHPLRQWRWLLLSGLAALVLGFLILIHWPSNALWLIGLFIAVELIVNGWCFVFIAFSLRKK